MGSELEHLLGAIIDAATKPKGEFLKALLDLQAHVRKSVDDEWAERFDEAQKQIEEGEHNAWKRGYTQGRRDEAKWWFDRQNDLEG